MSYLEITKNPSNGFGYVLTGEYGVGFDRAFCAIVTGSTLELLKQIGIVNHKKRLGIDPEDPYHLDFRHGVMDSDLSVVETVMINEPKEVQSDHVIWKNTREFYRKPGDGVIPPGQVVVSMLAKLGLTKIPGRVSIMHFSYCKEALED